MGRNSESSRDIILTGLSKKLSNPLLLWEFPENDVKSNTYKSPNYKFKRIKFFKKQ
jgi:hypothetical protein